MIVSFTLPCKAFSVNAYYYRNRAIKTAEARAWEASILELLEEHKILLDLAAQHSKAPGAFKVKIAIEYPEHFFYNRHGQISAKTFDADNTTKPLLDLIFGRYMDVNDKDVIEVTSSKRVGATYAIKVELELVNLSSN